MMQPIQHVRMAGQGITTVLLFGMSSLAGAEQMMMHMPVPAEQPAVVAPAAGQAVAQPPGPPTTPAARSSLLPAVQTGGTSQQLTSPVAKPPGPPVTPMPLKTLTPPTQAAGIGQQLGMPAVAKPPGLPSAPMPQTMPPLHSQGGGMAQLNSAAVCGTNATPRIININGSQASMQFKPGDALNIAGCGFGSFGKGGQVALSNVGTLVIDGWDDSAIHAHIDSQLSHVADGNGNIKLTIKPNGANPISSAVAHSFHAAREPIQILLPTSLGIYSQIYNGLKTSTAPDNKSTIVERGAKYVPFCPAVTNQQTQMVDTWPLDSNLFKDGFEITGVSYHNETEQHIGENSSTQYVMVGNDGSANYDPGSHRVTVIFQGFSRYVKDSAVDTLLGKNTGISWCSSRYSVSLALNGPRGVDPYRSR